MDKEKVKEFKELLQSCYDFLEDLKTIIKQKNARIADLESENERLNKEKEKALAYMKTDNYAKLKKEDMYWGYQMAIGMLETEIDRQKDRIAELEEALLDMVVQFCQMSKEGYLCHAFMSAEENAFDVLDIEYGEKVDDVYKRFNKKWGKKRLRL